ncbi:MAG TPA: hypothetical protein VJR89_15780, partial [Polyangiales bacterium]|nr:hypothetical protein [Polyangiales bacterium]
MNALFRPRAIERASELAERADVLRLAPTWTRWAYWVIVGGALAAVAYATLARVDEWAQGSALVRVEGTTDLTAVAAGTVARVAVEPGQAV